MEHFIPLSVPNFEGNEVAYVSKAVGDGWVSTGGPYIIELEKRMAEFLKIKRAVAVQSGTAALHLSLVDCGVGPEDAVFVPTITFIAAVNPVKYQFAHPIFIDADETLCMNPKCLLAFCEEKCFFEDGKLYTIEGHHHVKAIVVVHVFGNMADMESIMEIAKRYNLKVIEDATEALGTKYTEGKYEGCYAGTIGDYGAYSFNGNKIITTGGGGMLVAKDDEAAKHIAYLSTQAKDDGHFYVHNEVGYNYRMTNVQAAIGVAQMEELVEFISRKQSNYEYYKEAFKNQPLLQIKEIRKGVSSNCWFYALDVDMKKLSIDVKTLVNRLEERNVGTRPIWGLISEQKPYLTCQRTSVETAKYYAGRIINIPCSTNITKEEMEYVVATICDVVAEANL